MKLKVCGMKDNPAKVAELQPDYLGFIFWEPSKRFFMGNIPPLPDGIKKIGVFVDSKIDSVITYIKKYGLDGVQLHGRETPEYCIALRKGIKNIPSKNEVILIKVFAIKNDFDFKALEEFEEVCDYFLFDTKGDLPGGNGSTFNWNLLEEYPSTKPYFLSGGIGLDEMEALQSFLHTSASNYCHAIDVNSKFEIEPGRKHIENLKEFKKVLGLVNTKRKPWFF